MATKRAPKKRTTVKKNTNNYQGKEHTSVLQANTRADLDKMIAGIRTYAKKYHMKTKVLEKKKDPDGGYRAVVVSHNLNPIRPAMNKQMNRLVWGSKDPTDRRPY